MNELERHVESTAYTLLSMPPTVAGLFQSVIDEDLPAKLNPAAPPKTKLPKDAEPAPCKVWERVWREKVRRSVGIDRRWPRPNPRLVVGRACAVTAAATAAGTCRWRTVRTRRSGYPETIKPTHCTGRLALTGREQNICRECRHVPRVFNMLPLRIIGNQAFAVLVKSHFMQIST